jgi:hypothetical protein
MDRAGQRPGHPQDVAAGSGADARDLWSGRGACGRGSAAQARGSAGPGLVGLVEGADVVPGGTISSMRSRVTSRPASGSSRWFMARAPSSALVTPGG